MNTKKTRVFSYLFYLLGMSSFLTGFQVASLNGYGIQLSVVIALLITIYGILNIKNKKYILGIMPFLLLIAFCYINFALNSSEISLFFHAMLILLLQIGIYLAFNYKNDIKYYFDGYMLMAIISSVISILQSIPLTINHAPYLLNNTNFSLVSKTIGRGFGITPEPSVLASLLLPILPIVFLEKLYPSKYSLSNFFNINYLTLGIITIGLVLTRSQTIIFLLPLFFLITIFSHKFIWMRLFFPKKFNLMSVPRGISTFFLLFFAIFYFILPLLISRLNSGDTSGSFQIRFYSIILPLQYSFINPIFGNGFGSSRVLVESNQQFFISAGGGVKSGVDSVFARIIYEQGYLYFFIFTFLIIATLIMIRKDFTIFLFFLATVSCALFVYGYRDFLVFPFTFIILFKYSFLLNYNKYKEQK